MNVTVLQRALKAAEKAALAKRTLHEFEDD